MNVQQPQKIIKEIIGKQKDIRNVVFVGCGGSKADLYPAKYFLDSNAKQIKVSHYSANEFNYDTPVYVGKNTIVISASLGGDTPETVKANAVAKQHGAHVISLTRTENSPLTQDADYVIIHRFAEDYGAKLEKAAYAMALAMEILQQVEGYEHYEDMVAGFGNICEHTQNAAPSAKKFAMEFAQQFKDAPVIYVTSSGATTEVAYSTSVCLWMEMQWINSGYFHSGEFFHGPFEIVDKDVPFILLMNDGPTRPIDSRALDFLERFNAKVNVVDAKDFGLASAVPETVKNYFNPLLIAGVFRVYAEELSYARNHPLTKRRYMWKIEY